MKSNFQLLSLISNAKLTSSQLVRRHRCRQLGIVPLNHCRRVAHLLAERVYVSATTQEFKGGVSMP